MPHRPVVYPSLTSIRRLLLAALLLTFVVIVACHEQEPPPSDENTTADATAVSGPVVRITNTPTPAVTPTPSRTPLPTATPTITPTPTATAPIAIVDGDPLAAVAQNAAPQAGAPCGVVDLLDFPLDPPDALTVSRGGQDFNVFRNRYDGYHTGEDWWGPGGRGASFGEPVYSIGHGQVTFAHPYGWGIDQGTVILRHVYPDGTEFYSFYGHLDPPSIELLYGQCVTRGQQIGAIGRPRGSPHLHFEMRYHTPSDPGPGYWSHDPRRSGWLAPSHTIWSWRIAVSPGVLWQRTDLAPGLTAVSQLPSGALLAIDGASLVAYDALNGVQQWRISTVVAEDDEESEADEELLPPISATAYDAEQPILYTADRRGRITALDISAQSAADNAEAAAATPPQLLWDLQLHNVRGTPHLIPLPSKGVALAMDGRLIAFSPAGAILWRQPFQSRPVSWSPWQDAVYISASGDEPLLWRLDADGVRPLPAATSGKLVATASGLHLYDGKAVHRFNPDLPAFELFYELPDGLFSQGDIMALPDGALLLSHLDSGNRRGNRRLIHLDPAGALRWHRTYGNSFDGAPRLLLSGSQPYLLSVEENGSWTRVFLHRLDLQGERLTLVFSGGTRMPLPGGSWALAAANSPFFVNIGGGSLLALDAATALQVVCGGAGSAAC